MDEKKELTRGQFLRNLVKTGHLKNPAKIKEVEGPTISDYLVPYWQAFFALNTERGSNGFAPNPLGILAIKAELELHDLYTPFGVRCIRGMDDAYFKFKGDKAKRQAEADAAKKSSSLGTRTTHRK